MTIIEDRLIDFRLEHGSTRRDDFNEWAAEKLLSDDEELAWRRDRAALLEQPDVEVVA